MTDDSDHDTDYDSDIPSDESSSENIFQESDDGGGDSDGSNESDSFSDTDPDSDSADEASFEKKARVTPLFSAPKRERMPVLRNGSLRPVQMDDVDRKKLTDDSVNDGSEGDEDGDGGDQDEVAEDIGDSQLSVLGRSFIESIDDTKASLDYRRKSMEKKKKKMEAQAARKELTSRSSHASDDSEDVPHSSSSATSSSTPFSSSSSALSSSSGIDELEALDPELNSSVSILQVKEFLAKVCTSVHANPEEHIGRVHVVLRLCAHPRAQPEVIKLCLLSMFSVFRDELPSYRLHSIDDSPNSSSGPEVKLSKDVLSRRNFERSLLKAYKSYLQVLHRFLRIHEASKDQEGIGALAVKCMGRLLVRAPDFNYRGNIIEALVSVMNSKVKTIRESSCESAEAVFRSDREQMASLEIVRLIASYLKAKNHRGCNPRMIRTFFHLNIGDAKEALLAAEKKKGKKESGKGGAEKAGATRRLQKWTKNTERKKSRVDRKLAKEEKEIAHELGEYTASAEMKQRGKISLQILKTVFVVYFRIIKKSPRSLLMSAALEGVAKHAHLIDVNMVSDLVRVLESFIAGAGEAWYSNVLNIDSPSSNSSSSSSSHLSSSSSSSSEKSKRAASSLVEVGGKGRNKRRKVGNHEERAGEGEGEGKGEDGYEHKETDLNKEAERNPSGPLSSSHTSSSSMSTGSTVWVPPPPVVLKCILATLHILKKANFSLDIEIKILFQELYNVLLAVIDFDWSTVAEYAVDGSLDSFVGDLMDALCLAFLEHKQVEVERVAAFVRRLFTVSLSTAHVSHAIAFLEFVCALLVKYPKTMSLLDSEASLGGRYNPSLFHPEHCNPFASCSWELTLLCHHHHPQIAAVALRILQAGLREQHGDGQSSALKASSSSAGLFRDLKQQQQQLLLSLDSSRTEGLDARKNLGDFLSILRGYDTSKGGFNPNIQPPSNASIRDASTSFRMYFKHNQWGKKRYAVRKSAARRLTFISADLERGTTGRKEK